MVKIIGLSYKICL